MTAYQIRLAITYDYARPATGGRHLLRMLPQSIPGVQEVTGATLAISPRPAERGDHSDFFGNATTDIAFTSDHSRIAFTATARVERVAAAPVADISPDLSGLAKELAGVRDLGPDSPLHFIADSPRIRRHAEMTAYAEAGATAFATVIALGRKLHRDMRFDGNATDVDTPPLAAFRARHGVCQDFAQIMIAALRGIGVPAAYVSGFIRTIPPAGQPRLEGADAMHAWVRAWCGAGMGWVEFDPTNDCLAAGDHVVVAYGRDYGDVAPVAGVMRLSGGQSTHQAVDVVPV